MATLARTPTAYWDSCVWLGLINQEPDKIDAIRYALDLARAGKLQIVTSAFTLTEVVRRKCEGEWKEASMDEDDPFAELLQSDFVTVVTADWDVGIKARVLYRRFRGSGLKKPQDALHLATAVLESVDVMHTFDGDDLLVLNGLVLREDGVALSIVRPPPRPPEPPRPPSLFDEYILQ